MGQKRSKKVRPPEFFESLRDAVKRNIKAALVMSAAEAGAPDLSVAADAYRSLFELTEDDAVWDALVRAGKAAAARGSR